METQWINIVDTAVKIGLGSVITGFFTVVGLRYAHKSQQSKYIFEHKIKLLEQISADIEEYFNALASVVTKIAGITKRREIEKKENLPLGEGEINAIQERDNLLVSSWPKKTYAEAKLRLMKANDVILKLNVCGQLEQELRKKTFFDKEIYSYKEIAEYSTELNKAKKQVHIALSDFYDSLIK